MQVWAGNSARATQEGNRTAEPASNCFQVRWIIEPHRRRTYSERGPGKRGRLALKGPFRPSSPQASYRSLRHKWQSSFIPLRLLSPRKAFRLPQGPLFPGGFWVLFAGEKYLPEGCLSASQVFPEHVPLIRPSSSQAAYRSARRKRQASFTPLLVLSPPNPLRWVSTGPP